MNTTYYTDGQGLFYQGDMRKGDRRATDDELLTHFGDPLENTRAAKYTEIIAGADRAKSLLSSRYSQIEESTWPEQEAGARSILGDETNVKDITARLILTDEAATANAVALVDSLASTDGAALAEFAGRICVNADTAQQLGLLTLSEQRGYEAALRRATTVEEVQAIQVSYSVLQQQQ